MLFVCQFLRSLVTLKFPEEMPCVFLGEHLAI